MKLPQGALSLLDDWQIFYLPDYVSRFRAIERDIVSALDALGFRECMFPRLLSDKQFEELYACIPRFQEEWSQESMTVTLGQESAAPVSGLRLCHWQCEPFYLYLQKCQPDTSLYFYDRSGWSFRGESHFDRNRLLSFQRIEVTFFCPESEAQDTLESILTAVQTIVEELGIPWRLRTKEDEMQSTGEIWVRDLEAQDEDANWIEVSGGHLHGRLLIDGLGTGAPTGFVTGCCGIGMSRIVNLDIGSGTPNSPKSPR